MIAIILIIGAITLLYYLAVKPYSHWSKKNVPTGKVTPLAGDIFDMLMGKESYPEMILRVYNKVDDARYIGVYQLQTPVLMLKSPELIKQVCVKDFEYFLDHKQEIPEGADQLWTKNLVALRGQTWKNMRCTISPSFTSSKMKSMFVLMCHNAETFSQYYVDQNKDIVEVEFKDAFARYAIDVIANTAFGIQVDSSSDRENEFYLMGKEVINFATPWKNFVYFLYQLCPSIAGRLGISILGDQVSVFFENLVKDTIRMREEKNINRGDILGLLIAARKGQINDQGNEITEDSFAAVKEYLDTKNTINNLTDFDIASQLFIFFLGGFDTVSTGMCFMAYELAANPDIQKRLIEEIDQNKPKNGTVSYETIMSMTYMDMVVSESLRKWPSSVETDRVVTKPYTIEPENSNEEPVSLDVDDLVTIPILAIQRDPKYYPNPNKFDPERFSPENRQHIDPYTYLPFGIGPRNCVASRFGLLEMKAVFFYLLSNFEIVPIEKTHIPVKLSTASYTLTSENGFPLGLKKRR